MNWWLLGSLVLGIWIIRVIGILVGGSLDRSYIARQALELSPLAMLAGLVVVTSSNLVQPSAGGGWLTPEVLALILGLIAFLARAPFLATLLGVIGATILGRALL